jgi:hypothetical protein
MTKLHYSETNYSELPPLDINPLLLQLYRNKDVLVICSRQGMKQRIDQLIEDRDPLHTECRLRVIGIWEEDKSATFTRGCITMHDAVIIIGKDRIHEDYFPILCHIKNTCGQLPARISPPDNYNDAA